MNITKEQEAKFKKLGIGTYCELALFVPASYEDLRLHNKLKIHEMQLIDATVESVYKAPNSIQVTLYVHNFSHTITGVIFRPKPYMMHQFKVGERDYYYGMVECKIGHCSMNMPKKVTNVGAITPRYNSALRTDSMSALIKSALTKENLEAEGLKEEIIEELLKLHFIDKNPPNLKELDIKTLNALKYTELLSYMKQLSAKRRYFKALSSTCSDYKEWALSLPFKLTNEQIMTIEDIKADFSKDVATKRMIVGDVGSGKTMVILASCVMMLPNRSVLMAPTTILANQLYEEACKFLPHVKTVLVTNKSKKMDLDEFDFIIGTHALLYRELPCASLVMVDEQHRFGTAQRNMLEKLVSSGDAKPHYLQFSATPIPRTQAMIETAHIDVSLITSTPFKKDITSRVIHKEDFKNLLLHVESEIAKGNQILLVYPLVLQSEFLEYQSIDEARGFWEKRFSNVYVTHGKDREKEEVLLEFSKRGNILIATTVVEVGISLPRLSTVIVVGAERLGLSTLHQLRGRVSRTGLKGYCFLYTNQNSSERLDMFTKTISGFDIANLDLKFRKSGDLLKGSNQSGSQFKWIDLAEDVEIVKSVKSDLSKRR
ncbi:MAG: ATP-dependent DNA helicase RecG [Sulfurimonas sp. RIFOXYD12_FULL_33_39]|uniref:ATP-dependent DNA helicase RecG n=1 Tax=unclassified Sulfurimonas TaxID=2623549 RepID=UPI0008CC5072|nr:MULTISPECIES: ATP-dependent DNA helicase RecG [unclassified Sulfurimonas]OHE03644.1 MAG: ATP-dependent DNA helicase RecG [Sulfurimonas sp. RIFCSPLOWO2_12_FULL_34_6]OHE10494.1 MAG: ATP-dependent DNA helicase RecG [Sulfurimonas sp. RIFOXYD12_FULL_33_39]OHE14953.1 MAG: ATP-dependent DNA helicase RecG [Sulfurimonas sp. RIFOXYD2_FULL_34_21]DAB28243.1 MAG TPA: ATP-dependent DNA helicase RecG [Sulfurimonas sp. UBA10385]